MRYRSVMAFPFFRCWRPLDGRIKLTYHSILMPAIGQAPAHDFAGLAIEGRCRAGKAPDSVRCFSMTVIPCHGDHRPGMKTCCRSEGLLLSALVHSRIVKLDFLAPALHHRVFYGPGAVLPMGVV